MIRRLRARSVDDGGFTLIELLVVMLLMAVVGTVAAKGMITGMRVNQQQQSRVHALNEVKKSFERVTRDIRGANPLISAEDTSISVREVQSGVRRDVTYYLDGQSLIVIELTSDHDTGALISETKKVVLDNVAEGTTELYTYFDASGVELTPSATGTYNPLEAESVELRLRVELERSDDLVDFAEKITMRNAEA